MNLIIRSSQSMKLLERAPNSMVHTMGLKPNMTSFSLSFKSKFILNRTSPLETKALFFLSNQIHSFSD